MKERNLNRYIRFVFLTVCLGIVFSISSVCGSEKLTPSKAEQTDNANSWRYKNGEVRKDIKKKSKDVKSVVKPSDATAQGIDVSRHNGVIQWQLVKNQVNFAILRAGVGMDLTVQDDPQWEANVKGCEENGIPYGAYLYSYADNVDKAKSEAKHMIRLLKGKNLSYPVYYDIEDNFLQKLSNAKLGEIASAFLTTMENAGYKNLGVYSNKSWFTTKLTASVFSKYPRWIAQYNTTCNYTGSYRMWQYTKSGVIDGISGAVDLNYKIGSWNPAFLNPSVWMNKTAVTLTNGGGITLSAKVIGNNNCPARWKSSNTSVATVNSTGGIKTRGTGIATITVSLTNGSSSKCQITVKPKINKIKSLKKSGSKSIKVTWSKVSGVSGYQIYMSTKKNSGYKKIKTLSYKKSSYTKGSLKKRKRYYFKVRSYKKAGSTTIYSSFSAVKSLKR